jgi:hypothetical protein
MRRYANVRAVGLRPRNLSSFRMPRVLEYIEGNNGPCAIGQGGLISVGVFNPGTHEEDGPATWEALVSPRLNPGFAESR